MVEHSLIDINFPIKGKCRQSIIVLYVCMMNQNLFSFKHVLEFGNYIGQKLALADLLFFGPIGEVAPSLPTPVAEGHVIKKPSSEGFGHNIGKSRMSRLPAIPRPFPLASNLCLCVPPYLLTSVSLVVKEDELNSFVGRCGLPHRTSASLTSCISSSLSW